ncbi:MAG: TraI domain-containing protein [Legionella sp.]|nr:TraI domain-containing protein [Legionella sp.]
MAVKQLQPLNPTPVVHKVSSNLMRILSPEQLLSDEKRTNLIKQFDTALGTERFKSIGLTLINQLVSYYQNLPDSAHNYYSQPGGMLDYALNRADAALVLFKEHVLLNRENEVVSEEKKLWQYALFSAALLKGVGRLYVDLIVDLYDSKENFLKTWQPLSESLGALGSAYCYEFQKEAEKDFRCRVNLLLGRSLMPASGFAWIASDPEVLAAWLALLEEDYYAAGVLGSILLYADAIAIQRDIHQLIWNHAGARTRYYGRVSTFGGGESLEDTERTMGLEFVQWLQRALDSGRISVNEAPLQVVPGGLIMLPDAFKLFVREHSEFKNWQAVQNGFLSLGLGSSVAADGTLVTQYGVLLPKTVHVGKKGQMSAVAFIHQQQNEKRGNVQLPRLNDKGQWESPTDPSRDMQQRHSTALWGKPHG